VGLASAVADKKSKTPGSEIRDTQNSSPEGRGRGGVGLGNSPSTKPRLYLTLSQASCTRLALAGVAVPSSCEKLDTRNSSSNQR